LGRRKIDNPNRYRVTSVYLDAEKVNMLKALGYNLSELVDEVLDYVVLGKIDELKEILRKEIARKIEMKKKREEKRKEMMRTVLNTPIY